jgi:ketosteroid isomerase-like protein
MIGAIIAKQAIKSGFDALNNGNLDKFMEAWSDNCIWIYPGKVTAGGRFTGKAEVTNWFEKFIQQFPQRKFTLTHIGIGNIFAMGGNNIVSALWDLELTNKDGVKITNAGVTVLTIKGSKIVHGEDFLRTSDGDDYKRAWGDIK